MWFDFLNLHSTMYLLIRCLGLQARFKIGYLHSTMYLLILTACNPVLCGSVFTFHYVSINSTAYRFCTPPVFGFTFHYVSINSSRLLWRGIRGNSYLHSTMYLLIRSGYYCKLEWKRNLHSTMYLLILGATKVNISNNEFTFHYVSINSWS